MKTNKHYFEEAQEEANESWLSADGADEDWLEDEEVLEDDEDEDFVDDTDEYFEDDWDDAEGYEYEMAVGRKKPKVSRPYIVVIQNTSSIDQNNVVVLGSYTNAANAGGNFGNPVAIQISMGVPNSTYQELLFQAMTQPFEVGETYIQSPSSSQILETITIRHQDASGVKHEDPIIPIVDPYQFQNDRIAIPLDYRIDGYTTMIINRVLANITVKIYIYPARKISLGRAVAGRSAGIGYGNPGIVRPRVTRIERPKRLRGRGRARRRRR